MEFNGSKAAVMFGDELLVFLRDNKPGLRFANMWDFPGGGRENEETPFECIKREVNEEFGLNIEKNSVLWKKEYPAMHDPSLRAYFFVITISEDQVAAIKFGSEGQEWRLMTIEEFFNREDVVPHLKGRLRDYLKLQKTAT